MTESERKYFKYIREHKENIEKGLKWFEENLPEYITDEVYDLVNSHDMSKFSEEEFTPYAEYFYGDNKSEIALNYAWLHHIHHNPHHWQYWILNEEYSTRYFEMPKPYVIEMILDWWSFSWKQNKLDEIFNWYEERRDKLTLNSDTRKYIEEILDKMKEKIQQEK